MTQAAAQLKRAILEHDNNIEAYNKQADECVARFHVDNPTNIATYDKMMQELLQQPRKALSMEEVDYMQAHLSELTPSAL